MLAKILFVIAASFIHIVSSELAHREFEQEHMNGSDHVEVTDEVAFFKLHDLNKDDFWDEKELRSMYGSEKNIDPQSNNINIIIDHIFRQMDLDKDRHISLYEYVTSKLPTVNTNELREEQESKQKEFRSTEKSEQMPDEEPIFASNYFKQQNNCADDINVIPSKFRA